MSLYQKSLLATALLLLALAQLAFIATSRGWVGDARVKTRRRALAMHRYGGYAGLAVILFVTISCLFIIRYVGNPYKYIHITLGVLTVALVVSKATIARACHSLRGMLPGFGIALLFTITGAWLTSALWYLVNFR